MKGMFVELVRELRSPVRAKRQEKIREIELTWSNRDLDSFRIFAMGLQPAEMADICYALADAVAIPLLELLVDYAEINNDLMRIAFQSLEKTPASARLLLAKRLFASKNAMIRALTCRMLGGVGAPAAEQLVDALDDDNAAVAAAAIRAMGGVHHAGADEKLITHLRSASEEVRFLALDAMIRLEVRSVAFEKEALALFGNVHEKVESRRLAARALAHMRSVEGRRVLLAVLNDPEQMIGMRQIAAEALSGYADPETARALLHLMRGDSVELSKAACRSLVEMAGRSERILDVLDECLADADAGIALSAAEALGSGGDPAAGEILGRRLRSESRPVIIAALAGALGRSGFPGSWKALLAKFKNGNRGSLPLLAALADAASLENLDEFAQLLDELPESGSGELVLRRLAAFSRTVRPTPAVVRRAVDILDSGNRGLAVPAVEILAYSGDEDIRDRLLTEMACLGSQLPAHRLLRIMLRFKNGELAALFAGVSSVASVLTAAAAAEADCLGNGGAEYFRTVASWVREERKGAREGLAAAAHLDPTQLLEAMRLSPDRVFLLEAWAGLNARERLRHTPDLDGLFAASTASDKLLALDILARLGEERYLRAVASLAFAEHDAAVKAAAIGLTRILATAEG